MHTAMNYQQALLKLLNSLLLTNYKANNNINPRASNQALGLILLTIAKETKTMQANKPEAITETKLTNLDKINNLLITYAYHQTCEIKSRANEMQNQIIKDQPKSNVSNSSLNLKIDIDALQASINLLNELQEQSLNIKRALNHNEIDNLLE
jgi:hypothetical protein